MCLPPAPRQIISKDTAKKRAYNTGDSEDSPKKTCECGSLLGRRRESEDCIGTGSDTGTTGTSDGSANNEGGAVLCNSCAGIEVSILVIERSGWS